MINGINQQNISQKIDHSAKNAKAQSAVNISKPAGAVTAPRAALSLAAAAGIPADKLTSSIISFARFFSLPLKPSLLADIRRHALSPNLPSPNAHLSANAGNTAGNLSAPAEQSAVLNAAKHLNTAKTREALSLCAAAAESKGVELNQKGLDSYAEAVDPDSRRHDEERKKHDKEKNDKSDKKLLIINSVNAEGLKKLALENENPLLEILNKLPGKNNQRWIVLPFDFSNDDKNIFVSMRILLDDKENHSILMALDVVITDDDAATDGKKFLFVIEAACDRIVKLNVFVWEELNKKNTKLQEKMKKELSECFNIPADKINIKNNNDDFPLEGGMEPLAEIDEAV